MCVCRPMINHKFEEKTCGDGPDLATMFTDDKNMQTLIYSIQVGHSYPVYAIEQASSKCIQNERTNC